MQFFTLSKFCGLLVILSCSFPVFAFEAFSNLPGSRAMGMAGIFSAQADDASAIWYNPAGIAPQPSTPGDVTFELGSLATRELHSTQNNELDYDSNKSSIKLVASYVNKIPFINSSSSKISSGFAIFRPYELTINVDQSSDFVNPANTFGIIDSAYYQVSGLLAGNYSSRMSLGGTIDVVWADINCQNSSISCVENGPLGFGATLGLMYDLVSATDFRVRLGAMYRSKANLDYKSGSNSPLSLTNAIQHYLPDRPETRNIGLNLQWREAGKLINLNTSLEQTIWSKVDGENQPLTDYTKFGISNEWIFSTGSGITTAYRAGVSIADPDNANLSPEIQVLALGFGIGFNHHSFLDLAFESRELDTASAGTTNLFSLSYSHQL